MADYRHFDTNRPDGCYVTFRRIERDDCDADPRDYLFQDDDYREEDQARLNAWLANDWHMIGIQAEATVEIIRNGVGTSYTLLSAGLWSIESDSGEEYLDEVFGKEKASLLSDIRALANAREAV